MKHGSRQSREARQVAAEGAEGKAPECNSTPPQSSGPQYAPELQAKPGESLDLLAQVESEDWLAERLKAHGCDIYAGGPYETYADRLGAAIVRNHPIASVIVGRGPNGKPETYREYWERFYGRSLAKASKTGAG